MKRNRIYVVLGVLVAAGLGLWLGPRLHRGPLAGSLPELLNYAPADSTMIFYADAAALRSSPVLAQLASSAPPVNLDKDYQEFVRATGFDFQRDLDRVVVAGRAQSGEELLIFAEGRFDRAKIAQYAQRSGKTENHNGRTEYVLPSPTQNKKVTLTFLEGGRIAIADGGDILAALPASADVTPAFDAAMRERLARVAGSPSFSVFKISPPAAAPPSGKATAGGIGGLGSLDVLAPLQGMRWVSLAAQPDDQQIVFSAEGECASPAEAEKARSTIDFLRILIGGVLLEPKARGNMSPEAASAVTNLLQSARVSNDGVRVRLLVALTPKMLVALGTLAPNGATPPAASPTGPPATAGPAPSKNR